MDPIVIIGTGLAGYNVARELRKLNKEIPLTVIAADSAHFYSKPMLSSALGSKKTPEMIPLNTPEQMTTQIGGTVRPHTRVTAIDPPQHTVSIGDEKIRYSKLVLALGADQIRLPLKGDSAHRVMTVNDLEEYARFRSAIKDKPVVAVIGAGLIGCEFAHDLSTAGHRVEVVDIAAYALPRLLPAEGGTLLQRKLSEMGVKWHFGTAVGEISTKGDRMHVRLANDDGFDADVVLSAIGLRPRTELARAAGLKTDKGILVNRNLETSDPDIYALGDCIEIEGLILPYVMPIMHAARALAATLAGKPTRLTYPAMPVLVKTPACPTIVSPPPPGAEGRWEITATDEGVKSLFIDPAGKLIGFALNGKATEERAALAKQLPPVLA